MNEKALGPIDCCQSSRIRLTLFCLLAAFCVFLSSCSSNSSSSSSTSTTTAGALATITIAATSNALVTTNTSDQFTAGAADSSANAITGLTFTWASSNPNVATVDPSTLLVTPLAPGVTAITASSGGVTSNTVYLTVTAPLAGQYAFLLQGFDDATGDQVAIVGSFITDGNGNVTSGIEDVNGPNQNGFAEATFTGTYTTGTDNRGLLTITNSNGATNFFTFVAGTLSGGIPTAGRMIEFDDSSGSNSERSAGVFYLQDTSALALSSISGPYALQFFGQHPTPGSWYVSTGAFTADGNGDITSGELDTNSPPAIPSGSPQSFTATLAATSNTSVFGQLSLGFTSGVSGGGLVYIVSPTRALFMEGDPESTSGLKAGQILAQTTSSFSNASLSGVSVEYEQGLGSTSGQPLAVLGLITFGSGTAALNRDLDDSGTLTSPQTLSLTFPGGVAANGRAVLLNGTSESAIVYLVSANEGFIMSATSSATMGFFQPQNSAPPFSGASINGSYFGGTVPPTVGQSVANETIPIANDAELISSGNGGASVTLDVSLNGGSPATSLLRGEQAGLGLSFPGTGATTGRATDNAGDIYYVIGPSNFLMLIPDAAGPSSPTPVIDIFQH